MWPFKHKITVSARLFAIERALVYLIRKEATMAQVLNDLAAQVSANTSVIQSAVTLINGIADRVSAAVTAAIANGATAAELAPVQAEVDALKAADDALAASVAANTPVAP